ncbi:hypothetical protein CU633_03765 [Bacillus sp. V3-13]|nr:hypothetical protein CU633_03765 [Bacillus sp. V3-13]
MTIKTTAVNKRTKSLSLCIQICYFRPLAGFTDLKEKKYYYPIFEEREFHDKTIMETCTEK